ncbi:MAG: hypothetical protein ACE5Z5_13050 [Candidatus Bathyarchaeia archaeon]
MAEKEEKKPALYVNLEIPETRVRIDIPKEVMKQMVEGNPDREEAIKKCMVGAWAERWATQVSGMTREEAAAADVSEFREAMKRRLCTRLYEALGV